MWEAIKQNWLNILSVVGINLVLLIGWFFLAIKRFRNVTCQGEKTLKECKGIVESHQATLDRLTELRDSYHKLFESSVRFPDSSNFQFFGGVYFFTGVNHPNDIPLCPKCLVKDKQFMPLAPQPHSRFFCPACKFEIYHPAINHKIDEIRSLQKKIAESI